MLGTCRPMLLVQLDCSTGRLPHGMAGLLAGKGVQAACLLLACRVRLGRL